MSISATSNDLAELTRESYRLTERLQQLEGQTQRSTRVLEKLSGNSENATRAMENLGEHAQNTTEAVEALGPSGFDIAGDAMSATTGLLSSLGMELTGTPKKIMGVISASIKMVGTIKKVNKALERHQKAQAVAEQAQAATAKATAASSKVKATDTKITATQAKGLGAYNKVAGKTKKLAIGKTIAKGALAVAKGVLTAAQWLLNIAKMANPAMLLVAGIAAVGAAIVGAIRFFGRAGRAAREKQRNIEQLSETTTLCAEDMAKYMERMGDTSVEAMQAVYDASGDFAERFGMDAADIRDELVTLVEEYGCYEQAIASWEAKQMEALDDLSSAWNVSSDEIQAALQEQGITMEEWEEQQEQSLQSTADEWGICAEDMRASMQEMGMSLDEMTAYIDDGLAAFASDVRGNVNNITNGFREIPTGMEKSAEEMRAVMDANAAATETWEEQLAQIYERGGADMYQFFRDQGPQMSEAMGEMLENDDEWYAWQDSIDNVTRVGMDQAYQNIESDILSDAIHNQFDMAADSVYESGEELGNAYEETLGNAQEQGAKIAKEGGEAVGKSYIDGTVKAVESGADAMITPVKSVMDQVQAAFESGMDVVKVVVTAAFTGLGTTMKATTTKSTGQFNQALTTGFIGANLIISRAISNITAGFSPLTNGMKHIGVQTMQGFINGVRSKQPTIIAAVSQVTEAVAQTLMRILRINSPSRVMRDLGGYTMDGYTIGMEDKQKGVEDIAKSTADTVTDELSKATQVQNKLQAITSKLAETKNKYADQTAAMMKAGLDSAKGMAQNMDKLLSGNQLDQQLALAVSPPDASYQTSLMEKLIETVEAGKNIVMDSGELVGATYAGYDNAAGFAISYNSRWGR